MVDGRAALRNAFNRRTYNPRAMVIRSTLSVLTGPVCRNNGFNTYIGSNYLCGTGYLGCSNGKSRISGLCHYFIYHIQSLEGNFVTPLIHEKATAIGPVVIIAVQFMLYFLIGFLGVLIALPLLVCTVIVVKEVYIKGILNDPMENTTPSNIEGENIVDEK